MRPPREMLVPSEERFFVRHNQEVKNCRLELGDPIPVLAPGVRWHQVVRTIVDHKLTIVLAAVLDGERPDRRVVG